MANVPLYMNDVNGWEKVTKGVAANADEVSHLVDHSTQLEQKAARMRFLSVEQAALTASKQLITQEMQRLFREGQTLLDFVQTGVRQHYGLRSDKLVEFGLRPFRGKTPAPAPETTANPDTTE
jgi:hypothetical protein